MKLLIDIGHPAHIHLFKFVVEDLIKKGWKVLFTIREKDNNILIIKSLGFDYKTYGTTNNTLINKVLSYFVKSWRLFKLVNQFSPDITISNSSFYLSHVSWLLHIPNITLEDTGNMEQVNLYSPFTSAILTSTAYHRKHGKKQITYNGYHELAYLHQNYRNRLLNQETTIIHSNDKPAILLRLVKWSEIHDIYSKGMGSEFVSRFINNFKDRAHIYISAEGKVDDLIKPYIIASGNPHMHAFLQNIDIYIGEGATMASECALLGVPAIYINSLQAGTIDEQEKAGLIYHISDEKKIIEKTEQLLNEREIRSIHQERAQKLIESKIDVSAFLVWFIEDWPVSMKIMKENPDYQDRFK